MTDQDNNDYVSLIIILAVQIMLLAASLACFYYMARMMPHLFKGH
jgi:hypothetical protein